MQKSVIEISEILKSGKGIIKKSVHDPDLILDTLVTDSRDISSPESSLFFAIKNAHGNDGHKYIKDLYDKGVSSFVVENIPKYLSRKDDVNLFVVKDTVAALQEIGKASKDKDIEYVAIAGSKGKTTLKEQIYQLLDPLKKVSRSPRSYNSQIGVPLSLWDVSRESSVALVETGMSRPGEMQKLSETIEPETVLLLNVYEDPSDDFRTLDDKVSELIKIAAGKSVKTVIYNYDSKLIREAVSHLEKDKKKIGFSFRDREAELYLSKGGEKKTGEVSFSVKWNNKEGEILINGHNNIYPENVAASIAFMLHEGIDINVIKSRFGAWIPYGTRINVSEGVNGCIILKDSYINDSSTLPQAVNFMLRRKTRHQKSAVILGDVDIDEKSRRKEFEKIGKILGGNKIDRIIGIGKKVKNNCDVFPCKVEYYNDVEEFLTSNSPSDFSNEIILIRGREDHGFRKIHEMLETRSHETVLEVNLDSLVSNYKYFKSFLPAECGVIAMVKASGYGTGSYEIAKTLQDSGASYLAVAVVDEGRDLRNNGISMPIMVMNPTVPDYGALFENSLEPEVFSISMLKDIIRAAGKRNIKSYPVHLKLDTGMHRMGFIKSEIPEVVEILRSADEVSLSSVFSHLATADCPDMDDYTRFQLDEFIKINELIESEIGYPYKKHILNSAGIIRFSEYHFDMVRLGIGLYGVNTLSKEYERELKPVASLRSVIISVREWDEGITIGYGRKGEVKKKSKIATIPIGYADGINRHLGNGHLKVNVNGKQAPTIGNICMDACMIDVTGIDCKPGDIVEIFGEQNPIYNLSEELDTIPYEILTSISPRVKRVYFRE